MGEENILTKTQWHSITGEQERSTMESEYIIVREIAQAQCYMMWLEFSKNSETIGRKACAWLVSDYGSATVVEEHMLYQYKANY